MEDHARQFGAKVKSIRKERDLTLDDLGRLSGVSKSTLSKIENGVTTASFETVLKVSRALQTNFVDMQEGSHSALPSGILAVTKSGMAEKLPDSLYDYYVHSTDLMVKNIIPLVMHVHIQSPPPPEEWSTHIGEEFVYVIRGAIELHTQYYAPKRLDEGESAHFDSSMRHAYVNLTDEKSIILSVFLGKTKDAADILAGNGPSDSAARDNDG